jgi:hypothetical protein
VELEDDNTAVPRTHIDDEYAHAGERDPKILITTSRDPSSRLTQFAKELKLVFPNAQRINRGGQVNLFPGASKPWSHSVTIKKSSLLYTVRRARERSCAQLPQEAHSISWAWQANSSRPDSKIVWLAQIISELVETCRNHDFTDIVVVHEHRGEPDGMVVCHLPYGPTAFFGVYNTVSALQYIVLSKQMLNLHVCFVTHSIYLSLEF